MCKIIRHTMVANSGRSPSQYTVLHRRLTFWTFHPACGVRDQAAQTHAMEEDRLGWEQHNNAAEDSLWYLRVGLHTTWGMGEIDTQISQ